MLSLVDQNPIMEANSQKLSNNNTQEAVELLGLSSSDSLDSPSFAHFQAPKLKRKVRFKKPFRSHSRQKSGRSTSPKSCQCSFGEGFKVFSYFIVLAIVCALLWYVMTLSTRIQELQAKFSDFEAGNRNTPEALHVIHSNLKQLDSNVTMLYIEVRKNIADIENITNEVKSLKETASSLRDSIAAAPAIQQLPKDMNTLSESVANFGSKMNALESNIKEIKDQQSNMQTTAQNLSGELDGMKTTVQDLTNSSEVQAKSTVTSAVKDAKLLETNLQVDKLKEQLLDVINSVEKINTTCNSQLNAYNNMPDTVKTIKDAVMLINNTTLLHDSRLLALESAIHSNITFRLDQLESERVYSFKKPEGKDVEEYVNKTISETILQLINKNIFHTVAHAEDESNLQSLEQTHDVLVLLATLLQKFEQIPKSYILSHKNATELVENMLLHTFEEVLVSRDTKIEMMEQEIHNISSCIPNCHSLSSKLDSHQEDLTTPVFVQSTVKPDKMLKDSSQAQLIDALA